MSSSHCGILAKWHSIALHTFADQPHSRNGPSVLRARIPVSMRSIARTGRSEEVMVSTLFLYLHRVLLIFSYSEHAGKVIASNCQTSPEPLGSVLD